MIHNDGMTSKRKATLTTPAGNLTEAELQPVIGYQIAQASVVVNRIYEKAIAANLGLHRLEYSILMLLRENPHCTASSLAKALNVSTPNIALWLDRIISKGLLARVPNAADRRSNHLRLTDQGIAVVEQVTRTILAAEEATLSTLSFGERIILAELLHKVAVCRGVVVPDGPLLGA